MRRLGLTLLVATALFAGGCVTHTMQPLPGRLASRLIVDNGVSELDGRVLYLNPARAGQADRLEVPFAGASVDVLGPDGRPLAAFPTVVTDARGRFHHRGLKVGEPYFVRARLTDAAGQPRQLYAFVLPEGRFTCVELSVASTIVAQKLAASPEQLPTVRPGAVGQLIEIVRKTLAELMPPPAPGGGPATAPPAGLAAPAVPPPAESGAAAGAIAPAAPIWVPGPDGRDGTWWSPPAGEGGGAWWIETPCGGHWWSPNVGGTGGRWWVPTATGGRWEPVPAGATMAAPGGGCPTRVTPPPGEQCGCVWVPDRTGGGAWFVPNGRRTGGSWWVTAPDQRSGAWRPSAGAGPMDWLSDATGGLGGPSGPNTPAPDTVTWITLPGGQGGYWWSPTGGPGGAWWIETAGGGYWWTSAGTGGGTPPGDGGPCGCVWIRPPGASTGHWFLPDGDGRGGAWYMTTLTGTGAWWHAPAAPGVGARPAVAPPAAGGAGGAWTGAPGGGTDYVWIVEPGGGGHWWARPSAAGSGAGSWWIATGQGGGYWYTATGGGGTPPPGPDGREVCGCHYVVLPGSGGVGYWFWPGTGAGAGAWYITHLYTGGGGWVAADSPAIARAGVGANPTPTPAPASGGAVATPTPAPRARVVRWLRLPGGGGVWYYPAPSGAGAIWTGTRWALAATNGSGYVWLTLPGGGGAWIWPSPDGSGCCVWVPDGNGGGRWVWILFEAGAGAPPAPGGTILTVIDLGSRLEALTAPTWAPGAGGGGALFDQLATGTPALQTQLERAIETILNVNVLLPFKGVNDAPFPRKDDPRYLLIGTVELRCALELEPAAVGGVAYALNGREICRTDRPLETWKAEYDTRQTPDGDYFLTAHEAVPGGAGLGRLLAKGYARVRNTVSADDPCADQWD